MNAMDLFALAIVAYIGVWQTHVWIFNGDEERNFGYFCGALLMTFVAYPVSYFLS